MQTPGATWTSEMNKADVSPRFIVEIYDGTNTWSATSGYCAYFPTNANTTPGALISLGTVSEEINPLTRELEISECEVVVQDAWIRPILVANYLEGKQVKVYSGTEQTLEADFLLCFTGTIKEIQVNVMDSTVSIKVNNIFSLFLWNEIYGRWIGKHPLQCMYDGAGGGLLELAGFPVANIDTASFDPSDARYATTIGHWNLTNAKIHGTTEAGVNKPTKALDLIGSLMQLMYGQLIVNESGQISYKHFDESAAAVADLTESDIIEGSFEQEAIGSNIINEVIFEAYPNIYPGYEGTGWGVGLSKDSQYLDPFCDFKVQYIAYDTESQDRYKYPGMTYNIKTHKIDTRWLNYGGVVFNFANSPMNLLIGDTQMYVQGEIHGMAGLRDGKNLLTIFNTSPTSQPSSAQLGASKPAWIAICDRDGHDGYYNFELVKATGLAIATGYATLSSWWDPNLGTADNGPGILPSQVIYSPIARGQKGTTARQWDANANGAGEALAFDITILVETADTILKRFKDGCPIISFKTPLKWLHLQRGDFVTVTYPNYLYYNNNGLLATTKWEIIGKEIDPFGDPPCVKYKCAKAALQAIVSSYSIRSNFNISPQEKAYIASMNEHVSQPYAETGLNVVPVSGLTGKINTGTLSIGPNYQTLDTEISQAFAASKDTYISKDMLTGSIIYQEVANGAAVPPRASSMFQLGKVVTGGASISSITDQRAVLPIKGSQLIEGTGPLTHLSSAGALDNVTSVTARSLDNITDGTTYKKVAGVTSSNQVSTSGLPISTKRNHNYDFSQTFG